MKLTYKEHTTVTTVIGVLNNQPPAYTYDGEIEKVLTPGIKRRNWKIGKIIRVIKGKDVVQGGEVQVFSHKTDRRMLSRPIQKLYPLEILWKKSNVDKNSEDSPIWVSSKGEARIPLVLYFSVQ